MVRKQAVKKERISPRQAAVAACEFYANVTDRSEQASIEEVELNESGTKWVITLGFGGTLFGTVKVEPRSFKKFEIDAYTGTVVSMKIREA